MSDHQSAAYGTFLLRASLGLMFLAHAALKIVVFTPTGTAQFFVSLGLPAALAYVTILAELGGGALLLAGILTRWTALALVPVLLGAIIFDHGANGWVFSNPGGGWEFPAFWAVALVVQALLGDGAFALSPAAFAREPVRVPG
ncbi:MAG TPA: DoxX family protein [Stellaceae bacterium]|nr:DoxX family protein [Stellaceae bacterium]